MTTASSSMRVLRLLCRSGQIRNATLNKRSRVKLALEQLVEDQACMAYARPAGYFMDRTYCATQRSLAIVRGQVVPPPPPSLYPSSDSAE